MNIDEKTLAEMYDNSQQAVENTARTLIVNQERLRVERRTFWVTVFTAAMLTVNFLLLAVVWW